MAEELPEQEDQFLQEAQEYASGVADTVGEAVSGAWDAVKPYASTVADFTPVVGEAKGAYETYEAFEEGDYFGAGINAAATLLGVVPVLGDAAGKGLKTAAAGLRKEDEVEETIEQAAKFVDEFGESKQLAKTLTDTVKTIEPPKNTQKAYKLFRTKDGRPDEFFPLFVNADQGVPTGQWIPAEVGPLTQKGKVKSKIGELAYRPGWHSGDYASASHIGGKSEKGLTKPDYRPANQVWAEVEVPNDVDWQSVADSRASVVKSGPNKGKLNAKEAHITDQVPQSGHYRYKTNPNMQGNWIISGEMKVNKTLSSDEVKKVGQSTGIPDLPTLPEVIDQKKLKLADLNDESVKELKKYYPDKLAELSNVEMNEGGLMSAEAPQNNRTIVIETDQGWVAVPQINQFGEEYDEESLRAFIKDSGPVDPITQEELPVFEDEEEAQEYAKVTDEGDMPEAESTGRGYDSGSSEARGAMRALDDQEPVEMYHGGMMLGGCGDPLCPSCGDMSVGIDAISGNPIPPGSNEENVRDDIPAVLSDGEYVVPADVVRYHGLKTFMSLRDEAKFGLMSMYAEGQIQTLEEEYGCEDCDGEGCDCEYEEDTEYETPEENVVEKATPDIEEETMEVEEEEEEYSSDSKNTYRPSVKLAVMKK